MVAFQIYLFPLYDASKQARHVIVHCYTNFPPIMFESVKNHEVQVHSEVAFFFHESFSSSTVDTASRYWL